MTDKCKVQDYLSRNLAIQKADLARVAKRLSRYDYLNPKQQEGIDKCRISVKEASEVLSSHENSCSDCQ